MKKETIDHIEIFQGDITDLDVDAIVNAANSMLLGGGGVDGAIHRAAGPELLEECRTIGGCPTGEARITKGYRLPANYVIHTVGPVYRSHKEKDAEQLLRGCYRNSLLLAVEYRIKTIAFPAISCGVYGYPLSDACRVAVDTVCEFIDEKQTPDKVVFALFSFADFEIYKNNLKTR